MGLFTAEAITKLNEMLNADGYEIVPLTVAASSQNIVIADPESGFTYAQRRVYAIEHAIAGRYCAECKKGYAFPKETCPKCKKSL